MDSSSTILLFFSLALLYALQLWFRLQKGVNSIGYARTKPIICILNPAFTSDHPGYRVVFNRGSLIGFFLPNIRGIVVSSFSSWVDKHSGMSYLTWTCIAFLTKLFHLTEFEKVGWDIHSHVVLSLISDKQSNNIHVCVFPRFLSGQDYEPASS
jgi:hypothetical protein